MAPLSIAVLVPTFRRPEDLQRCLHGLRAQTRWPDEVIVIVRRDDHETLAVVEDGAPEPPPIRRVTVNEPGVVAALSAGLDAVRTDVVAITDDDAVPMADWLAGIERHFTRHGHVGAVGGRDWVHEGERVLHDARRVVGRVRWYGRIVGNHHLGVGPPRAVDVLKGVNMSFRMHALNGLRPDGRLRGKGAQVHFELGLCLGVLHRGWTVLYDPAVAVHHYPAVRFDEDAREGPSRRALSDAAHNELYLLLRWLPAWRKPLALGYAVLIGSRQLPGVVTLTERLLREPERSAVLRRFWAAERGRLTAVVTATLARRESVTARR